MPFGDEKYLDREGRSILVKRRVILTGENLNDAQPGFDSQTQEPTVNLTLDNKGARIFRDVTREGITIAAPGFYAPQGRWVRLEPQDARLNEKIESFDYRGRRITNFEMEGSALAGLAALMGHRAATICTIIAQRIAQNVDTDYKPFVRKMISTALDKLAVLE